MNKKLVIGNWKMNLTVPESTVLIEKLKKELGKISRTDVAVCPTFLDIYSASKELNNTSIAVGAQNCYFEEEGAYTGEISPVQLMNFAKYVIVGHSERRHIFGETDKMVARKAAAVVEHGMIPVICVGETYHEKGDGLSKVVVMNQVEAALSGLTSSEVASSVIAYEPVWAISTNNSVECKPTDAEKMAKNIRALVQALYGKETADRVGVIYGGNVNKNNALGFAKANGIDGALVGAASLDHSKFTSIVKEFDKNSKGPAKVAKPRVAKKK